MEPQEPSTVQLPANPAASPTPDPSAPPAQPVPADAALSSPPRDKDKVNVSVTDMNSSFDSNSGYQASNSDTGGNSLFNHSKYGTRRLITNAKPLELLPCHIKLSMSPLGQMQVPSNLSNMPALVLWIVWAIQKF